MSKNNQNNNQNGNESSNEKISLRQKHAEEGCLNAAFTEKGWFVKIKPAYAIDKVVFCFVKKGSSGKDSFNVYLDLDVFDLWMDDVQSFRLTKIIANEVQQGQTYPAYYKSVTGENGSYMVGICASSKTPGMYVINGSGKHKENGKQVGNTLKAFVPVSYDWLRITAKYYQRTCASRFSNLANTILKESQAHHNPAEGIVSGETFSESEDAKTNDTTSATSASSVSAKEASDKDAKTAPTSTESSTSASASASTDNSKKTSSDTASSGEKKPVANICYKDKEDKQMTVDSKTKICYDGAHYRLQVLDSDGTVQNVIITSDVAKNLGNQFSDLRKACEASLGNKKHTHFDMFYKAGTYADANVLFLTGIVSE